MIDLVKESITIKEVTITSATFPYWCKGYVTFANTICGENTLPKYVAEHILDFLDAYLPADNNGHWEFKYWLHGFLDKIDTETLSKYKGFEKLIQILNTL